MNSNKTPSSFFPRTCTHITHSFNKKGELRTALITGGDRLLILKDGFTLAESGSLFQPPYTTGNSGSLTPRVFHLCICPFVFFSIRVVVSTTAGIFLFELEDADVVWQSDAAAASSVLFGSALVNSNSSTCGASLQGRRLHLSTPEEKVKVSSVSYSVSSSAKSRRERDGDSTIGPLVEVGLHATRAEVITAEFITDVSLCIVFNDEVVIVTLHGGGGSPPSKGGIVDRVVWRSMGSYSRLAVCQYNRSIALALRSSTVAVFPCKCRQMSEEDGDVAGFSRAGGAARSETHPLFSPVTSVVNTTLFNASHPNTTEVWGREGPHWEIATRGIAASLGSYKVDQLEWHRASAHTLLCVTCTHIRDEKVQCLALYTVQSLTSVASFSNVHLDQQDCPLMGEESVKNKKSVSRTQLVLSGTIPLYDPHSPPAAVFTSIVSLFAHSSANLSSLNKQLDFLHIEKTDGTVRSSSFRFGNQKHASFAKLRAKGLSCPQLLAPLLEMYGPLSQVTVLPSWVNRPVELGKVSPYAEEIVRAHRYRVVCTFDTGLRCVVMLDLSSGVYRTECFLTLGAYRLTSLTSFDFPSNASVFDTDMNTEKLLAGLLMPPAPPTSSSDPACYVGIVLFAQRRSNDGFASSILTVAPFKEPLLLSNDVPLAQEEEEVLSGIEKVEFFMQQKCPDKMKMMPAFLKAVQDDTDRLLTQLTAKYGALETPYPTKGGAQPALPPLKAPLPLRLRFGAVTAEGVLLYASSVYHPSPTTSEGYMLVIPPVSVDSLSPVQNTISMGGVHVSTSLYTQVTPMPVEHTTTEAEKLMERNATLLQNNNAVTVQSVQEEQDCFLLTVSSALYPDKVIRVDRYQKGEAPYVIRCVTDCKGVFLVNYDVVVGILTYCMREDQEGTGFTQLFLYGLSSMQGLHELQHEFQLEKCMPDIHCFLIGPRGELLVSQGRTVERWLRCFPTSSEPQYHYTKDVTWGMSNLSVEGTILSLEAIQWADIKQQKGTAMNPESHILFSSDATDSIGVVETDFVKCAADRAATELATPPYHPDCLMQLIGTARWEVVLEVCRHVAAAGRAALTLQKESVPQKKEQWFSLLSADTLAKEICTSKVGKTMGAAHLTETPMDITPLCLRLDDDKLRELSVSDASSNVRRRMSAVFTQDDTLSDLTVILPQITLEGVNGMAQMDLLCIVEALHATCQFSLNVDEAAARYFFFNKLGALRRRLRLQDYSVNTTVNARQQRGAEVDVSSILYFDSGTTASRMVVTASSLWAVMSDCQLTLVAQLFGDGQASSMAAPRQPLLWSTVEASGAAFWLRSTDQLCLLAERMAVSTYQTTKDVTQAALMFCVAKKVNALAALCKLQNNMKLHAFFTKDFSDARNKEVASANAFAAVGKGLHLYGAAFFILAGDVRSAAQIIMQRQENVALALFVLRAASPSDLSQAQIEENLQWYRTVRKSEEEKFPPLDMWEDTCLTWLTGSLETKMSALSHIASHPTAHPEVLCALRYARDHVPTLAHHSHRFLSPEQELTCLLRLGRYSVTRRFDLCAVLHYWDAHTLLTQIEKESEAAKKDGGQTAGRAQTSAKPSGTRANMKADYDTGTLAFKGFGDSDDEDDAPAGSPPPKDSNVEEMDSTELVENKVLSEETVTVLFAEIDYSTRKCFQRQEKSLHLSEVDADILTERNDNSNSDPLDLNAAEDFSGEAVNDEKLFSLLSLLFISVSRQAPLQIVEHRLSCVLFYLQEELTRVSWGTSDVSTASSSYTSSSNVSPVPERGIGNTVHDNKSRGSTLRITYGETHHTHTIYTSLLFLALGELAARTRHYLLATALLKVPYSVKELKENCKWSSRGKGSGEGHVVTAFFASLLYYLQEEEELSREEEQQQQGHMDDSGTAPFSSPTEETDDTTRGNMWDYINASQENREGGEDEEEADLELDEGELSASLFSWFHLHAALNVSQLLQRIAREHLEHPPRSPSTRRAIDAGVLPASYGHHISTENDGFFKKHNFALRLLLSSVLMYATTRFDGLSEELGARLRDAQWGGSELVLRDSPNGVFLEINCTVKHTINALNMVLLATASEAAEAKVDGIVKEHDVFESAYLGHSFFFPNQADASLSKKDQPHSTEDSSLLLLELCLSVVEVFWQLPAETNISTFTIPTAALVGAVKTASAQHDPAKRLILSLEADDERVRHKRRKQRHHLPHSNSSVVLLLQEGSPTTSSPTSKRKGDEEPTLLNNTLCCVECSWLRRYHTHVTLRKALLRIALRGGITKEALSTDRVLLSQTDHSVLHVACDYSSCDSLVWSTEAGTTVAHGYREMLAGDNAQALEMEMTEKNIATAAFSKSLQQQQDNHDKERSGVNPLPSSRPLSSVSARSYPSAHPYLPFYLTCQRDGCIDIYPFASQECLASYTCPRKSAPMTRAAFSPSGYLFAVGLQDGTVVGWKFTASTLREEPFFCFDKIFKPLGVKSVFFCGEKGSYLVACGAVREPHWHYFSSGKSQAPTSPIKSGGLSYSPLGASPPLTPLFLGAKRPSGVDGADHSSNGGKGSWEATVGEIIVLDTLQTGPAAVAARCALPFLPECAVYLARPNIVLCLSEKGYVAVYEVTAGVCTILGGQSLEEVLAMSSLPASKTTRRDSKGTTTTAVTVTCMVQSRSDELIAIGTSNGLALILTVSTVLYVLEQKKQRQVERGEDPYKYIGRDGGGWSPSASDTSLLVKARLINISPSKHAVEDLQFGPSMLVAGLRDGTVIGTSLIPNALYRLVTLGV